MANDWIKGMGRLCSAFMAPTALSTNSLFSVSGSSSRLIRRGPRTPKSHPYRILVLINDPSTARKDGRSQLTFFTGFRSFDFLKSVPWPELPSAPACLVAYGTQKPTLCGVADIPNFVAGERSEST